MTAENQEKDYYYILYKGPNFDGAILLPQQRGPDGFNLLVATQVIHSIHKNPQYIICDWKQISERRYLQMQYYIKSAHVCDEACGKEKKVSHLKIVKTEEQAKNVDETVSSSSHPGNSDPLRPGDEKNPA